MTTSTPTSRGPDGRVRLVAADRSIALLAGLRWTLPEHGAHVVAAVTTAESLDPALEEHAPDVVLLGEELLDGASLSSVRRIVVRRGLPVLVLSAAGGAVEAAALRAGASGVVGIDQPPQAIARALTTVARGGLWLDGPPAPAPRRPRPLVDLGSRTPTAAELEVLRLVAAGCDTDEIAGRMAVSPHTVRTHVKHVLPKLGAENRAHAVTLAIRDGLLDPALVAVAA